MRAYKHVHRDYAEQFNNGKSIRVGTFSYYREIENGDRTDRFEGMTSYFSGTRHMPLGPSNEERLGLAAMRIGIMGNIRNLSIQNAISTHSLPEQYLFCASLEPDINYAKEHRLFAITNLAKFAKALSKYNSFLKRPLCRKVTYEKRWANPLNGKRLELDPFIKNEALISENEARIVWQGKVSESFKDLKSPRAARFICEISWDEVLAGR